MKPLVAVIVGVALIAGVTYSVVSRQTSRVLEAVDLSSRDDVESHRVDSLAIKHLAHEGKLEFPAGGIAVTCDRSFNVVSMYVDIDSPELGLETVIRDPKTEGEFGSKNIIQTYGFVVDDFRLPTGWYGYELLSGLKLPTPIGVPAGGRFSVRLDVKSDVPENDTIRLDAIVETVSVATCSIANTEE